MLFERVDEILSEPSLREAISAANREKAAYYDVAADSYLEIYEGLA